jgi:hypothetical protein
MGYICQNCYTLLNTYHKKEQLLVDKAKVVIQLVNFEASSSTSHDMTVITPCNAGTKRSATITSEGSKTKRMKQCSKSPGVEVVVNYDIPRSYGMNTPNRRKLTKLIIKGKPTSVANHIMKDPRYLPALLRRVGQSIGKEVVSLCSDKVASSFGKSKVSDLMCIDWGKMIEEVKVHAPCWSSMILSCFRTLNKNKRSDPLVLMIVSLLCNFRKRSMNVIQKVISIILYAGHCSKKVSVDC